MAGFSDIPIRSNGQKIEASWFNTIRLFLIQLLGDISGELTQAVGQGDSNQDVLAAIEVDSTVHSKVDVEYFIRRDTDTEDVAQSGSFTCHYKSSSDKWEIHGDYEGIRGDDAGLEFSIFEDKTSQPGKNLLTVRYSTSTLSGTGHSGTLKTRSSKWVI